MSGGLVRRQRQVKRAWQWKGRAHVILDRFGRANAATLGVAETTQSWSVTGSGSISAGRALLGAASNIAWIAGLADGWVECILQGDLNTGLGNYDIPSVIFRRVDATNYLLVRPLDGSLQLNKVDGGAESTLATATVTTSDGVDYTLGINCAGARVQVFWNGVRVIDHTLVSANAKFLAGVGAGIRRVQAGTGSGSQWDDFRVWRN